MAIPYLHFLRLNLVNQNIKAFPESRVIQRLPPELGSVHDVRTSTPLNNWTCFCLVTNTINAVASDQLKWDMAGIFGCVAFPWIISILCLLNESTVISPTCKRRSFNIIHYQLCNSVKKWLFSYKCVTIYFQDLLFQQRNNWYRKHKTLSFWKLVL